ncbi:hypothetical protein [Roseobacter sp. A03A-229]
MGLGTLTRWFLGPVLAALMMAPVQAQQTKADSSQSSDTAPQLRIGVRSSARPFAYRSDTMVDVLTAVTPGPLAKQRYTGYMVRICDSVLTEMMLDQFGAGSLKADGVKVVDIDRLMAEMAEDQPESRFSLLQRPEDRSQPFEPQVDILCDPATITNARRDGLIISPPVYLTGVSYVSQLNFARQIGAVDQGNCPRFLGNSADTVRFHFGLVGHTTSVRSGVQAFLTANEMPQYREALIAFLRGEGDCRLEDSQEALLEEYESTRNVRREGSVLLFGTHQAAAEAFCRGEIVHYIGDREIILQNVSNIPGCTFTNGDRTFTADRYAIFGRLDYDSDPERALRVARFFEILSQKIVSHPSIIDQAFYDTFHPTSPTRTLDIFFRSVRGAP